MKEQVVRVSDDQHNTAKVSKKILREFYIQKNGKKDTIGEIEVDITDPWNEKGEGDTLRWGAQKFNN